MAYTAISLLLMPLAGAASAAVASGAASASSLHDAAVCTEEIALDMVAPYVTSDLLHGDRAARAQLSQGLAGTGGRDGMRHLTVRDRTGAVLWSDEPSLVGQVDPLDPDEVVLLQRLGRRAEMQVVGAGPMTGQPGQQVIDAESATLGASGDPILVEAQLGTEQMLLARDRAVGRALPLTLVVVLLVQTALLPVVLAAARRLRRARQERAGFSLLAERAAEAERRAVAAELHDTVVQDLVGLGFAFDGMRLRQVADLQRAGAVAEMAEQASAAGFVVETRVDDLPELSGQARTALHLVVREAVRNAVRHSRARRLQVLVRHDGDGVELVVSDDGQGLPPDGALEAGHLGLVLYRQAAEAAGGRHTLVSEPGQGTRLVFRVPAGAARRRARPTGRTGPLQRSAWTVRQSVPPARTADHGQLAAVAPQPA